MKASPGQLEKLYQRYRFALDFVGGRDVLEVGCGSGLGLGYLGRAARMVVGGDVDPDNIRCAARACRGAEPTAACRLDAQRLPFRDASFDVVIMYEAVYYLPDPLGFIREAARVLREDGRILICTVNADQPGFHPSPFKRRYLTATDLYRDLRAVFDQVDLYGGFDAPTGRWFLFLKRLAVALHLMPRSLSGRAVLKRLLGPLKPIPRQVRADMAPYEPPTPLDPARIDGRFQVIYCVGRKNNG